MCGAVSRLVKSRKCVRNDNEHQRYMKHNTRIHPFPRTETGTVYTMTLGDVKTQVMQTDKEHKTKSVTREKLGIFRSLE